MGADPRFQRFDRSLETFDDSFRVLTKLDRHGAEEISVLDTS